MSTRKKIQECSHLIEKLYVQDGKHPTEIAQELGLKYHQPIYNFLHKKGLFEHHKNGTNITRKYCCNENFFESIGSESKAYFLGFVAADGYIDEVCNRIVLSLNSVDKKILEIFSQVIESNYQIVDFVKDKKHFHSKLSINSAKMVADCKKLGLYSGKSKTMGNIMQFVPDHLHNHFLRGYFDGDGCITYGAKYSSGMKYLIQIIGTKEFLNTSYVLNCPTGCSLYKYKSCDMYCFKISRKSQVDDFINYIYQDATIFLERKHKRAHVKPQ